MTDDATHPRAPATFVAILTYAVMAGFFTQSGVILGPAAAYFGRSLPDTAAIFSYLVGGNLLGIVASLRIFDFASIRRTLLLAYSVMFAGIAVLCATHVFFLACLAIALVGFGGGLGLSTGAVILSKTYAPQRRASAFLGTDCAFSVAGFIIPAIAGFAVARGYTWAAGYVVVGLLAALLLLVAARVRFPLTGKSAARHPAARPENGAATTLRIALFGIGLALYLCGQTVFLLWSPSYLQAAFGLRAIDAGNVVSSFWGPSIFGLIVAALLVTRVAPRSVLIAATTIATLCLVLIATARSAPLFFALTLAFGFSSTCMYKLMISIGSEQVKATPPQLLTFLLLSGSVGGVLAPFVSARIVHAFGPHAGPIMALICYATAYVAIVIALVLEKSAQRMLTATTAAA